LVSDRPWSSAVGRAPLLSLMLLSSRQCAPAGSHGGVSRLPRQRRRNSPRATVQVFEEMTHRKEQGKDGQYGYMFIYMCILHAVGSS
jgi:hypothetical protein